MQTTALQVKHHRHSDARSIVSGANWQPDQSNGISNTLKRSFQGLGMCLKWWSIFLANAKPWVQNPVLKKKQNQKPTKNDPFILHLHRVRTVNKCAKWIFVKCEISSVKYGLWLQFPLSC